MTIEGLFTYPAVQYLCWALLHFIWQGTVLAALFFAADVLTRRSHARLRYAVGCAVMLSMLVAFAGTIVRGYLLPSPSFFFARFWRHTAGAGPEFNGSRWRVSSSACG